MLQSSEHQAIPLTPTQAGHRQKEKDLPSLWSSKRLLGALKLYQAIAEYCNPILKVSTGTVPTCHPRANVSITCEQDTSIIICNTGQLIPSIFPSFFPDHKRWAEKSRGKKSLLMLLKRLFACKAVLLYPWIPVKYLAWKPVFQEELHC